ncbi:MAG: PEP-CTERM sorting domain-containing protein [Betaproteobacteria bacterium]|nr:PEP-CTERM sorting domain-containing protein [Betaproteobacteria bacterium]MBL8532425.1 PEP-CTERM sorting domain-containing protein [Betaproteobacteria bacterium]
MNTKTLPRIAALTAMLAMAGSASAATGMWDTALGPGSGNGATSATPWIASPAAGSLYAEWNFFNDSDSSTPLTIQDATPDIAAAGLGSGVAQFAETTGGAFITGGGNVYSPTVATAFTVSLPGVSGATEVWLRAATLGSLLEASATLNGVAAEAQESYSVPIPGGGFGGDEKEWYWRWTLPTAASSLQFSFASSASSVSLDQVAVYAAPVPEPGTYAMFGLGLAGLAAFARRCAKR